MEQNTDRGKSKQVLKDNIFIEPATGKVRPYLVEYISLLIAEAKKLPEDELLDSSGNEIAADICGAIAWQDAEGVENDGWLNEKNEPVLFRLLDIAGVLDADAHHPDKWQRLFEIAKQLN